MNYIKNFKQFEELNNFKCKICGSPLYPTYSNDKVTLQCSSDSAKFWEFERGSKDQKEAHEHFMGSIIYVDKELV